MEAKIVKKELGPEAELTVEFKEGKIRLEINHAGSLGGAGAFVEADAFKVVDAITDAIPGDMDDTFIDPLAKKLLEKKKA